MNIDSFDVQKSNVVFRLQTESLMPLPLNLRFSCGDLLHEWNLDQSEIQCTNFVFNHTHVIIDSFIPNQVVLTATFNLIKIVPS